MVENLLKYSAILFAFLQIACSGVDKKENSLLETPSAATPDHFVQPADSVLLQQGIAYLGNNEYDEARKCLLQSAESEDIAIKAESYLYLNSLEMRLENYQQAFIYLEEYHRQAIALYNRALEAEKSIRSHKDDIDLAIRDFDNLKNRNNTFKNFAILIALIVVFAILVYVLGNRKKNILLNKGKKDLEKLDHAIEQKKKETKSIEYEHYLVQAEVFMQTVIYKEIVELGKQQRDKHVKVLSYQKQDILKKELDKYFDKFIRQIQEISPNLTENDVKLCCLSLLPLDAFPKALCYGSTEVNIIKQRKHQIKKKMAITPANTEFFAFVFDVRKNSTESRV